MKKWRGIVVLINIFFTPALVLAGNKPCNILRPVSSLSTNAHVYANVMADSHWPVVITRCLITSMPVVNTGGQRSINCGNTGTVLLNRERCFVYFHLPVKDFLPPKTYLFCIYPSHDFW